MRVEGMRPSYSSTGNLTHFSFIYGQVKSHQFLGSFVLVQTPDVREPQAFTQGNASSNAKRDFGPKYRTEFIINIKRLMLILRGMKAQGKVPG